MKLSLLAPFVAVAVTLAAPVPQSPLGTPYFLLASSIGITNVLVHPAFRPSHILVLSSIWNAFALVLNPCRNSYVQHPNWDWDPSHSTHDNDASDAVVSQHHDFEGPHYVYQQTHPVSASYGLVCLIE
ncbi:hypothetical protein FRC01_008344, partial [Tulasnella sp. 417]